MMQITSFLKKLLNLQQYYRQFLSEASNKTTKSQSYAVMRTHLYVV